MDRIEASENLLRAMVGEGSMLTRAERTRRLVNLLGMLGSDHAGERDAVALAIERLRRERGLSWGRSLAWSDCRRSAKHPAAMMLRALQTAWRPE